MTSSLLAAITAVTFLAAMAVVADARDANFLIGSSMGSNSVHLINLAMILGFILATMTLETEIFAKIVILAIVNAKVHTHIHAHGSHLLALAQLSLHLHPACLVSRQRLERALRQRQWLSGSGAGGRGDALG